MHDMAILVTGGAGFIGSHLCDRLVAAGERVICVDNLFTGSRGNIKQLLGHNNFVFIEHDIVNPLLTDEKIKQIYNLACPASPVQYQLNPVHTIKASTLGMINMLGLARKHSARILQASTSEVYGDPEVHPQVEEYRGNVNPIGPRACYDEGKRCAETLCFDYHRMHGLEIKIARIFNTYGPRMAFNDGRVVSNFIIQALRGKPITLYGDGMQTRSFCYVDDMVDGLVKLMNSDKKITGPINLGNPINAEMRKALPIKILAQIIYRYIYDRELNEKDIIFKSLPKDDPKQRWPDIFKAIHYLGWEPKIDLQEGLKKTIADFKTRFATS